MEEVAGSANGIEVDDGGIALCWIDRSLDSVHLVMWVGVGERATKPVDVGERANDWELGTEHPLKEVLAEHEDYSDLADATT